MTSGSSPEDVRRQVERDAAANRRLGPWLLSSLGFLAALLAAKRALGGAIGAVDVAIALVMASGPLLAGWKSRQRAAYVATLTTPEEFLDYYRAQKQEEASNARRLLWLLLLPMIFVVLPLSIVMPMQGFGAPKWSGVALLVPIVGALAVWLVRRMRRARRILAALPS